jgi:predicted DNA-binding protein
MRLYFYGPPTDTAHLRETYLLIQRFLKQAGVSLSSNTQTPEADLDPEESRLVESRGGTLLDIMDGILIEGSTADPEVGYLLAYAIAQKKPTLFLSERGSSGRQILRYLDEKKIPKVCQIRTYASKTLEWTLTEFLKTIDSRDIKEIPRIKFTLRITPTIEEFLEWKTRNTKKKKADYLREEIDRIIATDKDFQEYLERKRRHSLNNQ